MSAPVASIQTVEENLKDTSNDPSMSLVEWTTAGGGETVIIHTNQSVNLNENNFAFNVRYEDEDSDNLEETFEVNSKFFEDTIGEENNVNDNLYAEFMRKNKISLDTFLYSSELILFDAFDVLPVKIEKKLCWFFNIIFCSSQYLFQWVP